VIWTLPSRSDIPNGVYQEAGVWRVFDPPVEQVYDHKADVIQAAVDNPSGWFPWLQDLPDAPSVDPWQYLRELTMDGVVMVDDERATF
jgi:hypothetical protein